jgi:hypothetical protein
VQVKAAIQLCGSRFQQNNIPSLALTGGHRRRGGTIVKELCVVAIVRTGQKRHGWLGPWEVTQTCGGLPVDVEMAPPLDDLLKVWRDGPADDDYTTSMA